MIEFNWKKFNDKALAYVTVNDNKYKLIAGKDERVFYVKGFLLNDSVTTTLFIDSFKPYNFDENNLLAEAEKRLCTYLGFPFEENKSGKTFNEIVCDPEEMRKRKIKARRTN